MFEASPADSFKDNAGRDVGLLEAELGSTYGVN